MRDFIKGVGFLMDKFGPDANWQMSAEHDIVRFGPDWDEYPNTADWLTFEGKYGEVVKYHPKLTEKEARWLEEDMLIHWDNEFDCWYVFT